MNTSIIKFGSESRTLTHKASGESCGVRLLTQKEFGDLHSLKGSDKKRKYREYLLKSGSSGTKSIAAQISTGDLLLKSYRQNPKNGQVSVVFLDKRTVTGGVVEDVAKAAAEMGESDLTEIIAKMEAELAARKAKAATLEITDADVAAAVLV